MTTRFVNFARRGAGAVAFGLLLTACDVEQLLDVPDPDVATPASVLTKGALPAVLAGAIGDFMAAYNGNASTNMVTGEALFTDEFIWAETFPTRFEFDVRSIQQNNSDLETVYRALHRARISASRAADGYGRLDPTNVSAWAEALNIEGLTYVLFGEAFCNGVPFSQIQLDGTEVYGPPQTNAQMFALGIARFDSALKVLGNPAGASTNAQVHFARTAKARALMDLNQPTQAAALVTTTLVPSNFNYLINHSDNTGRQNNGTFVLVYDSRRFSVPPTSTPGGAIGEGGNGLPFLRDSLDPRVTSGRGAGLTATGFDGVTPLYVEKKYPLRTAAISVINGTEARLLEAEADMRVNGANWLGILNTLRTGVGLAANLTDPGTQLAREDLFFKERAYWLFLTAHRLGDMRRLVTQYGRVSTSVFPTGTYFKGGAYGSDVNFPLAFDEKNNPNAQKGTDLCTDRNP